MCDVVYAVVVTGPCTIYCCVDSGDVGRAGVAKLSFNLVVRVGYFSGGSLEHLRVVYS